MNKANTNVPDWSQRLVMELKREKKKAIVLAVLGLVGVVVVARMVMKESAPSQAVAAGAGSASVEPLESNESATEPSAESFRTNEQARVKREKYIRNIDHSFTRDIFLPNSEYFPPEQEPGVGMIAPVATQDSTKAKANVVRAQARALVLQSTVISATPTAIINGSVLCSGGWISGFEVVEIASHSCLVEKDGVKVTLEMKKRAPTKRAQD